MQVNIYIYFYSHNVIYNCIMYNDLYIIILGSQCQILVILLSQVITQKIG